MEGEGEEKLKRKCFFSKWVIVEAVAQLAMDSRGKQKSAASYANIASDYS